MPAPIKVAHAGAFFLVLIIAFLAAAAFASLLVLLPLGVYLSDCTGSSLMRLILSSSFGSRGSMSLDFTKYIKRFLIFSSRTFTGKSYLETEKLTFIGVSVCSGLF